MASAISRRPWPTLTTARPAKPSISFLPLSVHTHTPSARSMTRSPSGSHGWSCVLCVHRCLIAPAGVVMVAQYNDSSRAPEAPILLGQLRRHRAHVGMPPRHHVRLARGRVVEIDVPLPAAHQRAWVAHVWQAERVAELVREHLVEHDVATDLAARGRCRDRDADGQADDAVVALELRDPHAS